MSDAYTPFGSELRRLRTEAGVSLAQLASVVHYSKGYLSKIENGHKQPQLDLARRCDTQLRADGALARLLVAPHHPERLVEPSDDEEVWTMSLAVGSEGWFRPMARREALALGAGVAFGIGMGVPARGRGVQHTAIGVFRGQFDQLRALGQAASPDIVLPSVIAQTHTLRALAARASGTEVAELLQLASRCAEYAGWMTQEAGDERGALWWTDQAVGMAKAAGDEDLAEYALVRRALVAFYRDDAVETISLARRAQERIVPPRIEGLAAQREAQGCALAGDYDSCMRLLDRAQSLLQRAAVDAPRPGAPILGTTNLTDPAAMTNGWCLIDLGRPRDAVAVLDQQVELIPAHALRTRARYGVRRALAYALLGEIDHACELAGDLIEPMSIVGSVTIAKDLRRLKQVLSRFHQHQSVKDLYPRLTAGLSAVG
ncbi:helix-turn-helix transcriptional regulator [Amycolatopsis sp. PS_44_ISF1]|uniref:helix-turn-helix domain-containing protein n=1 Tax=Amycolatopsis sp. PS_44_ISF1 TaxID=2974917 RepID=UPI0028DD7C57|nr:helix-turn-helix transcriptional regulator [Amycolatopsis sp. PS_44_ISF1]MDT8915441.1 helix-turn-helix domain-containing protein [Amycolatopsis sp. PS_44_ISF1]